MQFNTLLAAVAIGSTVNAHMSLEWPYAFRATNNPNVPQADIDYSITSPLNADGSNFPCKGYQVDMGTPAGASVVTWSAGGAYNFSVQGGATHGGGSCQIALSYDNATSFTVIHSYEGSCPLSSGEAFQFTLPEDAPTGGSMFAWVWYNEIGDREIYMDCASITIAAGTGTAPATAFADRPDLFVANLGNGCTTVEGKEVQYPDPGPSADVTIKDSVADDSGSYTGTCAPVKGIGGGSGAASSGGSTGAASNTGTSAATSAATSAETSAIASITSPSTSPSTSLTTAAPTTLSTVASSPTEPSPTVSMSPGIFATVHSGTASATATGIDPAAPSGTGSTGNTGAMAAGSACTPEGLWNCVDGTSFQQCAGGLWSVVQLLAPGTQCQPGQSSAIDITATKKRSLARRGVRRSQSAA
jgi:hypothetical protein